MIGKFLGGLGDVLGRFWERFGGVCLRYLRGYLGKFGGSFRGKKHVKKNIESYYTGGHETPNKYFLSEAVSGTRWATMRLRAFAR